MPFRTDGSHYLDVFEKQARLINSRKRFRLFSGPRKCGKTIGCAHAVLKHCRDIGPASFSILGATNTFNADGGAWEDLTRDGGVIDQWAADGLVEWVEDHKKRVRQKGLTKKLYCEILGPAGKAYIQLDSLAVEDEVEQRFKGRRYTGLWVTQMDEVLTRRKSFDILRQCLRAPPGVPIQPDQYMFLADVNPPPEGKDSWFYQLFFEEPHQPIPDHITGQARQALQEFYRQIEVITVNIDDNTFLSPEDRRDVYSSYYSDPVLLARYYYGLYVKASGAGYFADVWRPAAHVFGRIGNIPDDAHPGRFQDDEYLLLEPGCVELNTAWDYGGRNPAVLFIEPVDISAAAANEPIYLFKVHDELVLLKENISLKDFTEMVLEKMDALAARAGTRLLWHHYSDTSSFSPREGLEAFEARSIYRYSEGRIELEAAPKGKVMPGLKLLRRLMHEDRIIVDVRCELLRECLSNIALNRQGRLAAADPLKHRLDALRYCIAAKSWAELEEALLVRLPQSGGIVTVPL